MQVRYGRQIKFLKTFGFFEEMPWWSDAQDGVKPECEELDFAANKTSPGALNPGNFQEFPGVSGSAPVYAEQASSARLSSCRSSGFIAEAVVLLRQ